MARIKAERVAHALANLAEWKKSVQAQGATHLFPTLALLEAGAGEARGKEVVFDETPDEYDFWDRYFQVYGSKDRKPYFNPITLQRGEAGFPHSNSATIRKNTFRLKWFAATLDNSGDHEKWTLADDYADKFRDKVLTKGGKVTRVPVIDVAVIMLRDDSFPEGATVRDLETSFRARFPQLDVDYEKMFQFRSEDNDRVFQPGDEAPDYDSAIKATIIGDDASTIRPVLTPSAPPMDPNDSVLVEVLRLLKYGTSGIIFKGTPGTGKSYYARRIAGHLTGDEKDVFRVQLHPSYGYEDFVEGYVPEQSATSGFRIVDKTFVKACERAEAKDGYVVMLVDEINRGDPARVFGEVLTYIEREYRGIQFTLPFSGKPFSVPPNLLLLGTMNPNDRSVSHVDTAFVRRFDHIDISPSREVAEMLLEDKKGFEADQISLIGAWFEMVQGMIDGGIGHSFFSKVEDIDHLKLVWRYRMFPTFQTASEVNAGRLQDIERSWEALMRRLEAVTGDD